MSEYDPIRWTKNGWGFWDEVGLYFIGAYPCRADAEKALTRYAEWLENGEQPPSWDQ